MESVGSGDSHVTEKKAGEENESREKDESKKGTYDLFMCGDLATRLLVYKSLVIIISQIVRMSAKNLHYFYLVNDIYACT